MFKSKLRGPIVTEEEKEAWNWYGNVKKQMKNNNIYHSDATAFQKLERIKWGLRYCIRCDIEITMDGQTRFCPKCQGLYSEYTLEGLIYGN